MQSALQAETIVIYSVHLRNVLCTKFGVSIINLLVFEGPGRKHIKKSLFAYQFTVNLFQVGVNAPFNCCEISESPSWGEREGFSGFREGEIASFS